MKDFFNSDTGRWVLRLAVVVLGALVKAGYVPIPIEVIGAIDTSDLLIGSAALVPAGSSTRR